VSKNKLHLVVNVLAYLVMVCLAATGLLILYRLPHGSPRDGLRMLGMDRHGWGNVHWYLAITLLVLMVLHVMLHWKWVTNTLGSLFRRAQAGAGAGGSAVLLALALVTAAVVAAPWLIAVERGEREGGKGRGAAETAVGTPTGVPAANGRGRGDRQEKGKSGEAESHKGHGHGASGGHAIRGRDTLADAAREAGVPTARLIAELKLPAGTDPFERLGRLSQAHGFEIEDVRDAVERLKAPAKPALTTPPPPAAN